MARRKKTYLSDDSESDGEGSGGSEGFNSQEDDDSRTKRALFEHNGHKRQKLRRGGKEAAWEGIFGEEEDTQRAAGRGLGARSGGGRPRQGRGGGSSGRTDWTKAPSFVPKQTNAEDKAAGRTGVETELAHDNGGGEDEEGENDGEGSEDDDEEDSEEEHERRSPRVHEEEDDEIPRRGMGLGSRPQFGAATGASTPEAGPSGSSTPRGGIGASSRGGIGSSSRGGIGSSSRGGIGSSSRGGISATGRAGAGAFSRALAHADPETPSNESRGGIGSSGQASNPVHEPAPANSNEADSGIEKAGEMPSSFGAFGRRTQPRPDSNGDTTRPQRSFLGKPAAPSTPTPTQLTAKEAAHFRNIEGSFGAKMLANLGWKAGEGLGVNKDGRAVPVASGSHLRGAGISSGIRTEDSKREARRRGETIEDEEDEAGPSHRQGRRGKGSAQAGGRGQQQPDQSWKKQKKVKVKVEHKTYEQLVAEAGDQGVSGGVGQIIDARGGELKEVSSLSQLSLSSWTPSTDNMQLPELRHNLRLIVDVTKGDVDALAKEGRAVNERRRWALREEEKARAKIAETTARIARLEAIQIVTKEIAVLAAEQAEKAEPSLQTLSSSFDRLLQDNKAEYTSLGLDELIVGAIAQVSRKAFTEWQPFGPKPDALFVMLQPWRKAYNLHRASDDDAKAVVAQNQALANARGPAASGERSMTAWESLLYHLWLPKVRSAINNEWSASSPSVAVHLLETWDPILPVFIRDNILDQLVLPKVRSAVDEWKYRPTSATPAAKKPKSLSSIVFPWLPLLDQRMEDVLDMAKRRIRHVLRAWMVKDGVPEELARWKKDIYSSREWDKLLLDYVVPKLGSCLRDDFIINPRSQDMVPLLEWTFPWFPLIRTSTFVKLFEANFFPKWLDILYIWLVQPNYKADEVANWFVWWKSQFPDQIRDLDAIDYGFRRGLELMDEAMKLGSEAPQRLKKPVFEPLAPRPHADRQGKDKSRSRASTPQSSSIKRPTVTQDEDITFRAIAEEYAANNDLLFLPLGRSHIQTGRPLFKVTQSVDGRGGITVYVGSEAVFAQAEDGTYRAVGLEDMVKRAKG